MANRFQPGISFKSVSDCLEYIPENELMIVESLREVIFEEIEGIKEKLSFNVPFYSKHQTICFIWPGSIPWGGTKEGVQLGFTKGHLMMDDGYLEQGNRKAVFIKTFKNLKEVDFAKVRQFLAEAEMIDKEFKKKK